MLAMVLLGAAVDGRRAEAQQELWSEWHRDPPRAGSIAQTGSGWLTSLRKRISQHACDA